MVYERVHYDASARPYSVTIQDDQKDWRFVETAEI